MPVTPHQLRALPGTRAQQQQQWGGDAAEPLGTARGHRATQLSHLITLGGSYGASAAVRLPSAGASAFGPLQQRHIQYDFRRGAAALAMALPAAAPAAPAEPRAREQLLPAAVWIHVLSYGDLICLGAAAGVCRGLRAAAHSPVATRGWSPSAKVFPLELYQLCPPEAAVRARALVALGPSAAQGGGGCELRRIQGIAVRLGTTGHVRFWGPAEGRRVELELQGRKCDVTAVLYELRSPLLWRPGELHGMAPVANAKGFSIISPVNRFGRLATRVRLWRPCSVVCCAGVAAMLLLLAVALGAVLLAAKGVGEI
eukprot:TRINITY_DN18355_c0_g1_i1.p3 TRINITY_DN18355_c0_g1~~TRINITY_DN18355_c0_g1_i1.p3  ORF type:complete len:337 (+),score=114.43 TRINITY_DN18355_c0_g1_i1:74-1012(+)